MLGQKLFALYLDPFISMEYISLRLCVNIYNYLRFTINSKNNINVPIS